ncbi:MAG: hypothetical protein J0H41_16110 [Rhizobiales bacterium]|nr:hypothetical protein [Hyphomicrobiales bacterium]
MSETGKQIIVLHGGTSYHLMGVEQPPVSDLIDRAIYAPRFRASDLDDAAIAVVACRTHPKHIVPLAADLRAFLDRGGMVVAMGDTQPQLWLPNVRYAAHEPNYWWWLMQGATLGLSADSPDHSFHRALAVAGCSWHHHGVFDPPAEARVLLREREGRPIMYEDTTSTGGRMLLMSLDPIFHHGRMHIPKTTPFAEKFFAWLRDERSRR